jgi:L-threonylcarbamoyladenylate synthase
MAPDVLAADETGITRAAAALQRGELVAFPTETVYGLGADAWNPAAVAAIFAAKGRPSTHPLIVHVASIDGARAICTDFSPLAEALARAFWPGPLTLVLPAHPDLPRAVTAGGGTVGIRIPSDPTALALLRAFGGPIAAPSANRHQEVSPTRATHVVRSLGERIPFVLDGGPCTSGIESTVVSLVTGQILRPGPIEPQALRAFLPDLIATEGLTADAGIHAAPGLSSRHYAPRARLTIVHPTDLDEAWRLAPQGNTVALLRHAHRAIPPQASRILGDEPSAYARELFAALSAADVEGATEILVEALPEGEAWWALRDRLGRASAAR